MMACSGPRGGSAGEQAGADSNTPAFCGDTAYQERPAIVVVAADSARVTPREAGIRGVVLLDRGAAESLAERDVRATWDSLIRIAIDTLRPFPAGVSKATGWSAVPGRTGTYRVLVRGDSGLLADTSGIIVQGSRDCGPETVRLVIPLTAAR